MSFALRALAITCVVVAHGFAFNLGSGGPASVGLAIAYGACIICLGVAAVLLWRKTLE